MTTPDAPRGPIATVRIYHDEIYSLVENEADTPTDGSVEVDGKTYPSLGEYRVTGPKGEEEVRNKIQQTIPGGYTEVDITPDLTETSPGVFGTATEITHVAEFLLDRHAPGEHVTGLYCVEGDDKVAKRLAAVMGVDYLTTEPTAPAPNDVPVEDPSASTTTTTTPEG